MTRYALAAVLVAALGSSAGAQLPMLPGQPPVYTPAPPPVPTLFPPLQPVHNHPHITVMPGAQPGPYIPIHKSGGIVVGTYGYYPFDTGDWLLGGTDGLTRQYGAFIMSAPGGFGFPAPAARGHFHGKHGLFRR
jgi:hypothetical protein